MWVQDLSALLIGARGGPPDRLRPLRHLVPGTREGTHPATLEWQGAFFVKKFYACFGSGVSPA